MSSGAWTHSRAVVVADPRGLHMRKAATLSVLLRRAHPGTRLCLAAGGESFDLGETTGVRVLMLLRTGITAGDEVLILTSGPDAEGVLQLVGWALSTLYSESLDYWGWLYDSIDDWGLFQLECRRETFGVAALGMAGGL